MGSKLLKFRAQTSSNNICFYISEFLHLPCSHPHPYLMSSSPPTPRPFRRFHLKYTDEYFCNAAERRGEKATAVKSPCWLCSLPSVNVHTVQILTCVIQKVPTLNIYSCICSQTKKAVELLPSNPSFWMSSLTFPKICQLLFQKSLFVSAYFLPAIDKSPPERVCLFKAILLVKTRF